MDPKAAILLDLELNKPVKEDNDNIAKAKRAQTTKLRRELYDNAECEALTRKLQNIWKTFPKHGFGMHRLVGKLGCPNYVKYKQEVAKTGNMEVDDSRTKPDQEVFSVYIDVKERQIPDSTLELQLQSKVIINIV